jgi:hypothetical protein
MNPALIQQKILYGYAKAGEKLGAYFSLYRSATPINPIVSGNLVGNIRMSPSVSWDYMKANTYGNNQFNACIDAQRSTSPLSARVGDYLIPAVDPDSGFIEVNERFFVQSLQFDLPPRVVQCNRTISIIRPAQVSGVGNVGYVGYTPATSTAIMTAMPASVLVEGRGDKADTKLPTDTKEPTRIILIPNLGGVQVRVGDIVTDDSNQNYVIFSNELTDLGWRIRAMQVVNYK